MKIRLANESDLTAINEIIEGSKSFWNYAPDYLQAAIPLIKVNTNWLFKHEGYVLGDEKIHAFFGLKIDNKIWHLEHLWVAPSKIGQGLGRQALTFILSEAKRRNANELSLLPDPPAEGFYLKLGAYFTGKEIQSRVHNGPRFREMIFKI